MLNVSRCHNLKPDALQTLLVPQPRGSISTSVDVQPLELLCHEPFYDCVADDDDHLGQESGGSVLRGEGSAALLMLPELRELDVSYCHLPTDAICCLLGLASRLTVCLTTLPSPCAPSPAYLYMGFTFCCIAMAAVTMILSPCHSRHLPNSSPGSIACGSELALCPSVWSWIDT